MQHEQLLDHVAAEHRTEVSDLYAAYLATIGGEPGDDIDHFARSIFERGLITSESLEDFMTYRELRGRGPLRTTPDARDGHDAPAPARHYELMALIGQGAMGEVYLGRDATLGRTIAVKRVHPRIAADNVLLRRFLNEARVTAQLDHPAIVPVYGLESDASGAPSYAMKFVRGVTLTRFLDDARAQIDRHGAPDASHALRARVELFVPVLNAIAYAHRRGVLHRDLKPDNIMVGRYGQVLVMDWGIARVLGAPDEPSSAAQTGEQAIASGEARAAGNVADTQENLTRTGMVLGTPSYMSPEQATGVELRGASDQYTLGLILQEIATLRPARIAAQGSLMIFVASRGHRAPIKDDARGSERVPRALRRIIARATEVDPAARYASVAALSDDVARFLRDESTQADPDRGLARVTRWIGRHRGLAAGLGAALALLAAALVLFCVWQGERALGAERATARRRELALSGLAALVDGQGKRMSDRLHRYEALLEGIAGGVTSLLALPAPASDVVAYRYNGGQRAPAALPSYVVQSRAYGRPASLRAEYSAAWDSDPATLRPRIDELARVEPLLRAALLRSAGEETLELPFAAAEKLVLDEGVPLVWAYFSGENGLGVGVPGTWESYDSPGGLGYDHRREAWYRDTLPVRGATWTVSADASKLGLTVSCLEAVRDASGQLLGVAGVDMWLDRFIAELLEIRALGELGAEALLLDARGAVIVRSSAKDATRLTRYVPVAYEDEAVRGAIARARSGTLRVGDDRLALWTSLGSTGMTYLVVGPEAGMIAVGDRTL